MKPEIKHNQSEVLPLNSATGILVKSVVHKRLGDAVFRRADHRIFEGDGGRQRIILSA